MIEVYRDDNNDWHWRMVGAGKGKPIIAQSVVGYQKRSAMLKSLERVREQIGTANIIEAVTLPIKAVAE